MDTETFMPKTLQQAITYYSDERACLDILVAKRWPNGVVTCPYCEGESCTFMPSAFRWQCKGCRKQFSIKVGTFMEDSPIKLSKWFLAMWMVANCKNGVSSYEIHRAIGITQKSAWFMLHRIRLAFGEQPTELSGTVEADETYIGGLEKNKHKSKKLNQGRGSVGKVAVMGLLEDGGKARTKKITAASKKVLHGEIFENVQGGSTIHTDSWKAYQGIDDAYIHEFVDHAVEYVRDGVHTNGLENFFSLLKRMIRGTYVSVDPAHLKSYLDEQTFRFNERKDNDSGRFQKVLGEINGKRLTYQQLVNSSVVF
ncbi:MAG: IS1595 family transposase [Capsulimonadaceae bacterium]|nr:IS1595 family transposase [Capsulimonadaceae bacterium]